MRPGSQRGWGWLVLSLAIPIVAVLGLIVRSEFLLRGQEWRFRVRGYDPRDLLRGNYVYLTIEWGMHESASAVPWEQRCLCLKRDGTQHSVTEIACVDTPPCNVQLNGDQRAALARFYIPEDPQRAREIERAAAEGKAELVLVERAGQLSVQDLLIEGRSWKLYSEPARR